MLSLSPPTLTGRIHTTDCSPESVICALLNFAGQPDPRREFQVWDESNIHERAIAWRNSVGNLHPDDFDLPTLPGDIVTCHRFAKENGVDVEFYVDDRMLAIEVSHFDAHYGENAARTVLDYLELNNSTDTAHVRLAFDRLGRPDSETLRNVGQVGVPVILAAVIAFVAEIEVAPVTICVGAVALAVRRFISRD